MKRGGIRSFVGPLPRLDDRFGHARAHLPETGDVVRGVFRHSNGVLHRERVRQPDIRAVELIEWKFVVLVLRPVDVGLKVITEHVGRQLLRVAHLRPIDSSKVGEPAPDVLEALPLDGVRIRRDLLFEPILLFARKVARAHGNVRVQPHPAVAQRAEEIVDRSLLRRGGGNRKQQGGQTSVIASSVSPGRIASEL